MCLRCIAGRPLTYSFFKVRPQTIHRVHKKNADRRPADRCTGTGTLTMMATPKWELRSRYQPNKIVSPTSKAGVMTVHEQKVEQGQALLISR